MYAVDVDGRALETLVDDLGERIVSRIADLSAPDAPEELISGCIDTFGRIDVLGNVAGVHLAGHATDLTRDEYRRLMAINLDAAVFLSVEAIPHLLRTQGSIVNVTSHAGLEGVPYALAYSISKGGLVQLTRSLAVEYISTSLRVNAIAPAGTATPMASNASFPEDVDLQLLGRLGGPRGLTDPDEIAALFAFLASDEARSITGAVYTIDNGLMAS